MPMKKFLTEDWVTTFLSIPLIAFAALASFLPGGGVKISADLTELNAWVDIAIFFLIAFVLLYVGNRLLDRSVKGIIPSFVAVFLIALLAQ